MLVVIHGGTVGLLRTVLLGIHSLAIEKIWTVMIDA